MTTIPPHNVKTKNEYNSTQTNSVACYSNLKKYGFSSDPIKRIIKPPSPSTAVPMFGTLMKPYKTPPLVSQTNEYATCHKPGFNE